MLRPKISLPSSLATASALVLAAATAACASYDEGAPVRFLRNASDAASCQKVADVAAPAYLPEGDVVGSIADAARKKGADTVVLGTGERKGTAFRCEAPKVADAKR
jgi:hypothetical protein